MAAESILEPRDDGTLLHGEPKVLELIAKGAPLRETLDTLLKLVELRSKGMLSSILLLDEDGLHLRHAAAPGLPEGFVRGIDGQPIGERAGSCGTAAFTKRWLPENFMGRVVSTPSAAAFMEANPSRRRKARPVAPPPSRFSLSPEPARPLK